ncbi:MAG TPA: TonB-dependent siderophore receptor [Methylophilaceae bacterium]
MNSFKTKPLYMAVLAALVALPAAADDTAQVVAADQSSQPSAPASTPSSTAQPAAKAASDKDSKAEALPEVSVDSTQTQDKGEYSAPVSTIGGKVPTAVRDIPQSLTVINRAVLDAQASASLADALRNVPGITIGGAEGGQIGTNINLRGFTARTDIYLDGMRDRGQYFRDTYYLDSVEVLKGPSSMLFGRGSTGGVINQVRNKAYLGESASITGTVGTGGYYRSTMDYNHQLSDDSAMRIDVMGQDISGVRDVMENQDFGFAPTVRFGIGTPTEITLSALIEHNHDMPDYGIPAVNGEVAHINYNNFYGLTNDHTDQDVDILNATIKHVFSDNLTLRNQTQYAYYDTAARESAFGRLGKLVGNTFTSLPLANRNAGNTTALPNSQLSVLLISHDRAITDQSLDNQTDLIAKFDTGSIKHTLVTGLELGYDVYTNLSSSRNDPSIHVIANGGAAVTNAVGVVSLSDPAHISTSGTTVNTIGNYAYATANEFAVYANDTLEFNKQWKAVLGLRWDRFDADISNTINSSNTLPGTNTTPASAGRIDTFTSVRAGLIYQPTDAQSYYVSYGTSFDPSLETLALATGQQNIAPETSASYELGGKWDLLGDGLSLTSAIFRIEKDNARSQVSTGVYNVDGDVRVDGFEASLTGHITPKWQVISGYTYMDSEVVKASALDGSQGKELANTPNNTAMIWTTYNPTAEWEIGGGATALSSVFASNTDVARAPGYTRYDATVAYHQPKYDLRLNLLNLTDKDYIASAIPSDGGRFVPGAGRTLLGTATYRF